MAGGRFAKQGSFRGQLWNSNNANDSQIGGGLSVAPANSNIGSQAWQNIPGDRVVLSPLEALALGNNSVNNLYTGTYRYVQPANSTAAPTKGHGAFWVPRLYDANNFNQTVQDALYQVTADEPANLGVSLFAGVFLNSPGKGNNNVYWWIQESGKATCVFRTTLSGVATIGQGVYLAGAGNNNNAQDVGAFDQLFGQNAGTTFSTANNAGAWNAIDNAFVRFVGVAEQLPVANNTVGTAVDLVFKNGGFRW